MKEITMSQIPQNFKNNVDWIIGAYADAGITFPNGFQKDAIQNAIGAFEGKKWKNWSCDISLKKTQKGTFIIVEDFGTVGLTGDNMHSDDINAMMNKGEELESNQRLARFTSMFNSGGNTTGGGLYGAGKSVYSVASSTYTYYFDSLRNDGKYVSNVNKRGQVCSVAYEDDDAKKFINDETGLEEKTTIGTRVIIESPREELIDSIKTGSIIPFIQESWWIIIQKLDKSSRISVNGIAVEIPSEIKSTPKKFELSSPELYAQSYRVKKLGIYIFDKNDNIWNGISYYRKGMKIGEVDIKDIPEKVQGKFWGYIEVDGLWEEELAAIEDKVHFGVSKGKKGKAAYQNLKNYCNGKFRKLLIDLGYIKDKENEDKKLKDELNQIAEDIQDLFDKLGFEDLGKGPNKADFDVRWQDIVYPNKDTERVTTDDEIHFAIRIKSSYASEKKFEYSIYTINPQTKAVHSKIKEERISIKPNMPYKESFVHKISINNSEQYSENRIIISVKVVDSGKEKIKELAYFYDIEKPDNRKEDVILTLHDCIFPTNDSRRVNFGEVLKSVSYRIDNKRNHTLTYRLNISIHNASDSTCPKIVDVASLENIIKPYEEDITPNLPDIEFEQSVYEQHMSSGILELRARLIAAEADKTYEKGDRITEYHYKLFLNCDEKHGKFDAFRVLTKNDPDNHKRSWCTPGTERAIVLNAGHIAYLRLEEYHDIQLEYMKEQMLKQYVLLYLAEGKYGVFKEGNKDFVELEPQDGADQVLDKIEFIYYESLK